MSVGVAAEIKQKLDIVEIVGESVQLKKAGTTFKGLCPFHGEKTPSFVVTPTRETWKCFGCGKGGDLFSFVMERDGIDFPEALRRLAARAGVEIDERTSREDARRKRLRELLEAAISFYHQVLTVSKVGGPALDYLHGRGFTDQTIEAFQLGYAPDAWDTLTRVLVNKRGAREEELEAAGLAIRSERRRGVYDRFRGRVIFPIRDASGGAIGLGGRVLGAATEGATPGAGGRTATGGATPGAGGRTATGGRDPGPKYLNTPATPLFDKSRTLYLIDKAKSAMRRTGTAVLVEGNTDALMAHQAGFDNVVGTLGTALTPGQIELVTRYASRIALAYDVDAAGQSAATFGATELSALVGEIERSPHRGRLTDVGVVRLPEGRDPDEVMRDDPETWRRATEEPQPIIEYLIDRYAARHDPRTIPGRERLVNAVLPTIRTVSDPVRRDGYLQLLARRSGVEERVLMESLRRAPATDAPGGGRQRGGGADAHAGARINLDAVLAQPGALDPQAVARTLEPVEATLLRLLLVHPALQAQVAEELGDDGLISTPARELWRAMLRDRAADPAGAFARDRFLEALDPTLAALARTLYARLDPVPEGEALEQAVGQCLLALESRRLAERLDYLRAELVESEASGDRESVGRLRVAIRALEEERHELDQERHGASLLARRRDRRTADSAPSTSRGGAGPTTDPSTEAIPEPEPTAAGGPA
ncbi:MAG TPA: DNA primase [Candidatus Limnocylindrales bacterium]|nr:DNA primase [Candidatus Limnocylindrales bacterium]